MSGELGVVCPPLVCPPLADREPLVGYMGDDRSEMGDSGELVAAGGKIGVNEANAKLIRPDSPNVIST